jgi:hypothetical protein
MVLYFYEEGLLMYRKKGFVTKLVLTHQTRYLPNTGYITQSSLLATWVANVIESVHFLMHITAITLKCEKTEI